MSDTVRVSLLLEAELDERLTEVASALDTSKTALIRQAVEEYVRLQEWHLSAIDEDIRAADEGRVVAHKAVEEWVAPWGTANERPAPKCGESGLRLPSAIFLPPRTSSPRTSSRRTMRPLRSARSLSS